MANLAFAKSDHKYAKFEGPYPCPHR